MKSFDIEKKNSMVYFEVFISRILKKTKNAVAVRLSWQPSQNQHHQTAHFWWAWVGRHMVDTEVTARLYSSNALLQTS